MSATSAALRASFVGDLGFTPDAFQERAFDAIDAGASVVVAAPTGSGKTVVAEYAVHRALAGGAKAFYTAPIKALSNQKYRDFTERYGNERVGLLTGDNTLNERAPIVVMTTEVLRNMIYARSPLLEGLRYVVLDEVHFLQDAYRGSVWEEVIIHAPLDIDLVCLSATVSNADDLAAWVTNVRGRTIPVIHDERPVELRQLYLVGERDGADVLMLPTFVNGRPNPQAVRLDADPGDRATRSRRSATTPRRVDVIQHLARHDMLPAITFIFSRSACDQAVGACLHAGVRLTQPAERRAIAAIIDERVRALSDADLRVLDHRRFVTAAQNGFAAHHAGMVPAYKEAVEACFSEGLVKAVFATETLALGINMPARTVVIEKLSKFNGDRHEFLTPGEYTQLTGRAGRRGIDPIGYAAALWNPFVPFEQVASLASRRTYELRSSFRPTSNMAVNLVRRYSAEEAHRLLSLSFAQHQIDAADAVDRARITRLVTERSEAERLARCERGSVDAYAAQQLSAHGGRDGSGSVRDRGPRPAVPDVVAALGRVRPGDVIEIRPGEWVLAIGTRSRKGRDPVVRAIGADAEMRSLAAPDFRDLPHVVAHVKLTPPINPNSRMFRKQALASLQKEIGRRRRDAVSTVDGEAARLAGRSAVPEPGEGVSSCPDIAVHLEAHRRMERLSSEIVRLQSRAERQRTSIVDQFDAVLQLLESLGYLEGWAVTPQGRMLAGLYHEADLLVAECLVEGVFDGLRPGALAGLASVFVYEQRGPGAPLRRGVSSAAGRGARSRPVDRAPRRHGDLPAGFPKVLAPRWWQMCDLADALAADEGTQGLPLTKGLDPGFVAVAAAWAGGQALGDVLAEADISGGDFVRTTKTLIDLLRQIGQVAPLAATAASARQAAEALFRGVVAVSSIETERVPA